MIRALEVAELGMVSGGLSPTGPIGPSEVIKDPWAPNNPMVTLGNTSDLNNFMNNINWDLSNQFVSVTLVDYSNFSMEAYVDYDATFGSFQVEEVGLTFTITW